MLLKPWCIYFWQINGRIREEPEADGGDEYQPQEDPVLGEWALRVQSQLRTALQRHQQLNKRFWKDDTGNRNSETQVCWLSNTTYIISRSYIQELYPGEDIHRLCMLSNPIELKICLNIYVGLWYSNSIKTLSLLFTDFRICLNWVVTYATNLLIMGLHLKQSKIHSPLSEKHIMNRYKLITVIIVQLEWSSWPSM